MIEQHADNYIDAYALGALEPDEVAWVEAHLDGCSRCQELLRAARAVVSSLPLAVPPIEPPADLRQRVLARVHQEAQRNASAPDAGAEQASADTPAPGGETSGGQRRGGLRGLLRGILGDEPGATGDEAARRLAELIGAPGSRVWEVAGTAEAPGASAKLVGVPGGRDAVLVTSGLRALPPDRAYQVWLLRDGQPAPNAVFHVARDGRGRQLVHAPGRLSDFQVVAVTPEPASGSPAPTGPIVLAGELTV